MDHPHSNGSYLEMSCVGWKSSIFKLQRNDVQPRWTGMTNWTFRFFYQKFSCFFHSHWNGFQNCDDNEHDFKRKKEDLNTHRIHLKCTKKIGDFVILEPTYAHFKRITSTPKTVHWTLKGQKTTIEEISCHLLT